LKIQDELPKALNTTFLTSVAAVSRAQVSSLRSSVSFIEVGTPLLETQRQVNSFVEEDKLTEVDDDKVPRHPKGLENILWNSFFSRRHPEKEAG